MVRAPLIPPGSPEPEVPAWKKRHLGVVCMLSTGMKADGKLSHELIEDVKLKYAIKSANCCLFLFFFSSVSARNSFAIV